MRAEGEPDIYKVSMYRLDKDATELANKVGSKVLAVYRAATGSLYTAHRTLGGAAHSAQIMNDAKFDGNFWVIWTRPQPDYLTIYPIQEE